jgi:predicted O-methyltransferase YrrM
MKIFFLNPEQYVNWENEPSNYQLRLLIINCGIVTEYKDFVYQRVFRSEGRDVMHSKLLQEVFDFRPDLVVNSTTWLNESIDTRVLREIIDNGIPVYTHVWDSFIDPNTPHIIEWLRNSTYLGIADSVSNYLYYKNLVAIEPFGYNNGVIFPGGNCVFTDIFNRQEAKKTHKVTLIGSNEAQRVNLLRYLNGRSKERGFSVEKFGGLLDTEENTGAKKWVTWAKYAEIINQSEICLSSPTQSNRVQLKGKVFDYLACGTLCVCDSNIEIKKVVPKNCIVYYDSFFDCLNKIEHYLTHEEERIAIAQAGYEWFHNTCNYKRFWSTFLEAIMSGNVTSLPTVPLYVYEDDLEQARNRKVSEIFNKMTELDVGNECPKPVATALASVVEKTVQNGMKVLEVGSWKGQSTSVLASIVDEYSGMLFAVDHWRGSVGVPHLENEAKEKDIFSIFRQNLTSLGLSDLVKPIIMESEIASTIFKDNFFDLIFIDGDHRYSSVKQDIFSWLPKLKERGIICGSCGDGYYTQYRESLRKLIAQNLETDYISDMKGLGVHPGVVKALYDAFQDRHEIMIGKSLWYYQKTMDSQWSATRSKLKTSNAYYAAHVKILLNILGETTKKEHLDLSFPSQGDIHQSERISLVAQYCTQGWIGDLIQLGFKGIETTKKLAELAITSNRRLMIVPLDEAETQYISSIPKDFEPYKDVVDIISSCSLTPETIELIKNKEFCFAFIDGLDTYDICLTAIKTVAHCSGVVAIDNTLQNSEISRAFLQGSELTHRSKLYLPLCREGYLLWP